MSRVLESLLRSGSKTPLAVSCVMSLLFVACGDEVDPIDEEPVASNHETARSSLARDTAPNVSGADMETLIEGNHRLALDIYHELEGAEGNLNISPISIRVAFALLQAGARGETATEIRDTLHYGLEQEELHPAFNALDLALAARNDPGDEDDDPVELYIANAFWGQTGYAWLPDYLDLIAVSYGAGVELLDFQNDADGSRLLINEWVEDRTRDRIQDLLPEGSLTSDTVAVLTNALYLKAPWALQFDEGFTSSQPFTTLAGTTVDADLMTQTESFAYMTGVGYQALEMNFRLDELGMVFILPDDATFEAFEDGLDDALLAEILESLEPRFGTVSLPRFEFESEFLLGSVLQAMGMVTAFLNADLSGMLEAGNLSIDEVFHKTFIAVDEQGAEAAAATAIVIGETSAPISDFEFRADRPFLFLIRDRVTGAILFIGRVVDPS